MARDNRSDDEQPEARTIDPCGHRAGNAVEAFEDPFLLRRHDPDAVIAHAHCDGRGVGLLQLNINPHVRA